jgi:hypothetical protein
MAGSGALMALLDEASRRAVEPGGSVTAEDLERRRPLTPDERAEAEALLDALEREERGAEQSSGQPAQAGRRPDGRRRAASNAPNGSVLLRLPPSVHRALIERAQTEHTSLDRLILAYVYRGLGREPDTSARSNQA